LAIGHNDDVVLVNEMETMSQLSFASSEAEVYRFNLLYRLYHFAVGAAALVGAVLSYHFLILSIGLGLFSVFMISRPLVMAVSVDHDSVTCKGMFSENSIQRSSITAVEFQSTGKGRYLILWGNVDERENLTIPDLFAFDEAWDDWLRSYRDLSDDKPLSLF
jgi:hypothetical protein